MPAESATTNDPNVFVLAGDGLHVSYSTARQVGGPQFHYQDAGQNTVFQGEQIRTAESELGTLVTVVIQMTVDRGSTTFTLLLPRVVLRDPQSAPISTLGITTMHTRPVVGPVQGQTDFYTTQQLQGTATFILT
jgi:hypothetical protein